MGRLSSSNLSAVYMSKNVFSVAEKNILFAFLLVKKKSPSFKEPT